MAERYAGGRAPSPAAAIIEARRPDAYQAFSMLSSESAHEIMLDLRFKSGDRQALAYAYLSSVRLDRSEGLVLEFPNQRVRIQGRNLAALYDAIRAHRAAYVTELPDREDFEAESAAVVAAIRVEAV